ncbi:hypothetical protein GBN20_07625 [Plesiomonas shigelloides]|nr:hypothetical protein GBN20_07625 [Plesiomonas shigelloides]
MRLLLISLFFLPFFSYSSEPQIFSYTDNSWFLDGWNFTSSSTDVAISECKSRFASHKSKLDQIILERFNTKFAGDNYYYKGYTYKDSEFSIDYAAGAKRCRTGVITVQYYKEKPKEPCDTPKTDDQCNKGKTATITGNDIFWATGNYKGCTFTAADGVFIKLADGSMTGDATSTGSTGKSWCETTDSSYNPADDEALSKNPAFSPAKDNDPKNCKNGWVQAGGGKFHCLNDTSGNVDAPPDKVNPEDGSINSDKDGKPKPPDAGVGKPPTGGTDPDGGGGTGPDGGGDCEGEDCEGGGGTKPPARPADPWADILDAADVARVKADTQSVQDELADFYRSAASGFQININKPAAGAMPSYGDITQGGQKISLSMSWLDKISFADGRAGVLVLCSLIAAYIILVRR